MHVPRDALHQPELIIDYQVWPGDHLSIVARSMGAAVLASWQTHRHPDHLTYEVVGVSVWMVHLDIAQRIVRSLRADFSTVDAVAIISKGGP